MVTHDRIRLTGLLTKKPWEQGFFYLRHAFIVSERFREPMVRVRLVVERFDLYVARGAIQRDRLGQSPVRLQVRCGCAVVAREILELVEQTAAEAEAANV